MGYKALKTWPLVERRPSAILELKGPRFGVDLEYEIETERPTILGVSDGQRTVSVDYNEGRSFFKQLMQRYGKDATYVGHNFLQSDLFVFEQDGISIEPSQVSDTIVKFWLTNMHLCKTSKKASVGDGDEFRGRGFMNLWTLLSLTTDFSCYKYCRGKTCHGPCPQCSPFEYNGIDSIGPLEADVKLEQWAKARGVSHLYPLHRDLAVVLAKISRKGLLVDVAYVDKLRSEFREARDKFWDKDKECGSLPFNPNSDKQVMEFFKARGVELEDNTEDTVRDAKADYPNDALLADLLDYKELGNGPDRWFAPIHKDKNGDIVGFVDKQGYVHPRLNFFTSTARLMCSDPNMQNLGKRRIDRKTGEKVGEKLRRAIIAPDGYYLYRADYKNAENRVFLWLAGYKNLPDVDFHDWMQKMIGIKDDDPFALSLGGPRDAAKSVTHATDYLEGLSLLKPEQLESPKIKSEIACGARVVYLDWTFEGMVVSFTGINLAERAFKNRSNESRKKALLIRQQYLDKTFPRLLGLQREIIKQVEAKKAVIPPHGYFLSSYGYAEDRLKTAAACWGSQPVAHLSKLALLNAYADSRLGVCLQVHDEILFYVDCKHDPQQVKKWIQDAMVFETKEIPGLVIPVDVSYSPNRPSNWKEQVKL